MEADYVVFVAESWTIKPEDTDEFMKNREKYRQVSDFPRCLECVLFTIETTTTLKMGMAPILEGRVMGDVEWKQADTVETRFQFLGPKPVMN
jgi:hypothetical protein